MFDTQNDRKQVQAADEKTKANASADQIRRQVIIIAIVAGLLIAAIIAGSIMVVLRGDSDLLLGTTSSEEEVDTGLLGLQNPGSLTDVETTTKEDLEEEFEARPAVTGNDVSNFELSIARYLNMGDFSGLDSYLRTQESYFGSPSEDDAQALDDWSSKFPLLRSDTQIILNLINKVISDPAPQFQVFSDPETLAAATAWVPITMKIDAFLDWSALILPPPTAGESIQMTEYTYEKPNEKLAEIMEATGTQYLDVKAYDMTITGHQVRVTVVMGPTGYWQPFSVQDIGGTLSSNQWTKTYLKNELEPYIDYRSDLDEVCFLSPPDETPDQETNPDWWDAEGIYIGPGSEYQPAVIEATETVEGEETSETVEGEEPDTGEEPETGTPAEADTSE